MNLFGWTRRARTALEVRAALESALLPLHDARRRRELQGLDAHRSAKDALERISAWMHGHPPGDGESAADYGARVRKRLDDLFAEYAGDPTDEDGGGTGVVRELRRVLEGLL